jgi:predicted GNAT family acetyltransferase
MDEEIVRATGDMAIVNNTAEHRFEARLPDGFAILRYHYDPAHRLILDHTEVPAAHRHQGIATRLAAAALDFASHVGLVVVPVCPFVVAYLRQHPELNRLVGPATGRPPGE